MNANIPRPPKMPKTWDRLSDYDRKILTKVMTDTAFDMADKQLADTQEVWIKLACIILHDGFQMEEEELFQFIASWKRMYRRNARIQTKEEQSLWLEVELNRCFPGGFPQFRIDEMKGDHK